jgi:phosphatidylethanolamine-binding protein (PEBP) family uncharacterized protein
MRPIQRLTFTGLTIALTAGGVAGCSTDDGRTLAPAQAPLPAATTTVTPSTVPRTTVPAPMQLSAPWGSGGAIPDRYGCDTTAAAPALSWIDVPPGTVELALEISTDGSAEQVLAGIDPTSSGLSEEGLPFGAFWWPPSEVGAAWQGLCPSDPGVEHRLTLYALNQQLEAADDTSVTDVVALLTLTAIDQASVTGRTSEAPPPT